jgi:glycosyltransferase involved in cell wall biosynthesis
MKEKDLTIILSVYNRPNYTRRALSSLLENTKNNILIVDDLSKELNWKRTLNMIKDFPNVEYIKMSQNWGIDQLIKLYPTFCDTKYIYITENDMLISSKIDEEISRMLRIIEKNRKIIGTFYNSEYHNELGDFQDGNYVIKESTGGTSILIERELFARFIDYLQKKPKYPSWDWAFSNFIKEKDLTLISTKDSYAQHIGTWGLHAKPPYVVDHGRNFIN